MNGSSEFEIVNRLDENEWRAFVEGHPQGNIFHTPEMHQVFARAKGCTPTLWAAVRPNGRPAALLLPVRVTLFPRPLRSFSTRALVYGGVLHDDSSAGVEALRLLLREYNRAARGVLFTEMRNLTSLNPIQPTLQTAGFQYEEQLNYLIHLDRPGDELLQSIGKRTRHRIRRAMKRREVVIAEIVDRSELALFYNLVSLSYEAARVPLADRSMFEAAFDVLRPKGMVKYLLAWVGDQCVAASAELLYKDVIFGWYSGVKREFSAYAPNEILMWHLLEWGAKHGYRVYDFGGAGRSDQPYGVRDFKAKFGGELVSYGRNIKIHSPANLFISKAAYQIYRRINVRRTVT
ncbi:MAG: GNAT family N-acetyltransferase [Anaerolineaceae bacterium]